MLSPSTRNQSPPYLFNKTAVETLSSSALHYQFSQLYSIRPIIMKCRYSYFKIIILNPLPDTDIYLFPFSSSLGKVFWSSFFPFSLFRLWASIVAQSVKNLPAVQETQVWSLGWEDPLEKEMATHSSILAWKISWTQEPGGMQSMGSQRVGHDWVTNTYLFRL